MTEPILNRRTKVAYVITKSNFGGAQRYVYDLARSLPKQSFEAIAIFGGEGLLKEKLDFIGIRTIPIPELIRDVGLGDISVLFKLFFIFKKERPDVVHLNSSKIGGLGSLAARLAGVRHIIFTVHGWAFKEDRGALQKLIISFFSWLTVLLSHRTILVSNDDLERTWWMPFVQDKFAHVRHGVSIPRCLNGNVAREKLLGDAAKKFIDATWVGTIAELHKNKGLAYAIDAFSILARTKLKKQPILVIIGSGELKSELESLAEKRGVKNRVFFVGFKQDASEYLKAFDIFILSSIKEGLPYAILDAGLAGVPIVASHIGGIPEVITDMHSGILVSPKRSHDLAKAIQFLTENKKYRINFKNALAQEVKTNYSLKQMVDKTTELYHT